MSFFSASVPENNSSKFNFDNIELKHFIDKYIDCVAISEWSYKIDRIFISQGNTFNNKYLIKFLSSKLVECNQKFKTNNSLNDLENNKLISPEEWSKITVSKSFTNIKDIIRIKNSNLIEFEEKYIVDEILNNLTDSMFFRLLEIEPEKRIETILYHYRLFNKTLYDMPSHKLNQLNNNFQTLLTEVPYEIYTEETESNPLSGIKNDCVKTVNVRDLSGLLKTCAVIVIDISKNVTALSNGKEIFGSFKKDIWKAISKQKIPPTKNKRLIVVISSIMTWADVDKKKKLTVMREYDANRRVPDPEFVDHYEFELEVLAVNTTERLKDFVQTVIVWTGITYGFEQDLLKFAFDAACNNNGAFSIPDCENRVPVIHVENLARLVHKIISENRMFTNNGVFAVESPINTVKQIFTALGKACDVGVPTAVPLETFVIEHRLTGTHKRTIMVDIKINSSIDRLWPDFEWYCGKSSIIHKMGYLVETYKRAHNIKELKLLIIGPPISGKTKLARRLAHHYSLTHIEPKQLVQDHIDSVRDELVSLRQVGEPSVDSSDVSDDGQTEIKEVNSVIKKRVSELEQKLAKLYSSVDANDGMLEDMYLIPLLNEQILSSRLVSVRGYVLDGYPTTVQQAKNLFNDTSSVFRQIDATKLPDLTICLEQKPHNSPFTETGREVSNKIRDSKKKVSVKRRLMFTEMSTSYSWTSKSISISNSLVKPAKTIMKKTVKKRKNKPLLWDNRKLDEFLKMLNFYHVPIKMVDSPYLPLDFDVDDEKDLPEIEVKFEQLLNIVINEIQSDQQNENTPPSNKMNIITREGNKINKCELEQLKEKMLLLEEFEKISDFDLVESLSSDKYLMKHVTPILTKLIVKVAKVRPKDPIYFLSYMALKENPESLPNSPGYSKEGVQIQRLLEQMFHMFGSDKNIINSKPLITCMPKQIIDDNGDDESISDEWISPEIIEE